MKFWQSVRMAFQTLLAKKGRSVLTMLGTVIGVTSVIALVSVTKAQNAANVDLWRKLSENVVTVYFDSYSEWMSSATPDAVIARELMTYLNEDLNSMMEGVTPIANEYETTVKWGEREVIARPLYYGNDQFAVSQGFEIERGRDISYMDVERANPVVVIGHLVAQQLFAFQDPIGEELYIKGIPFTIIGVFRQRETPAQYGDEQYYYEYSEDNMILVPHTTTRHINPSLVINQYIIKVIDPDVAFELVDLVKDFLSTMIVYPDYQNMSQAEIDHFYQTNEITGYYDVYAQFQYLEDMTAAEDAQTRTLSLIAAISLVVGGIGIMNIMLVTVTERTREIGVRKAIGAPRRTIVTQFLIEATVLSGSGGVLGVLVGFAVTVYWGKIQYDIIAAPDLMITAVAFGGSLLMGVLFGIYPAFKAASLQPVDALRTE
jgi:putative ABC transport system permease protein